MDLVGRAHGFARQAYGAEGDLAHPLEVSRLVESTGAPDVLVAAALLHDVLEDTDVTRDRLSQAFGSRVAALVCTLTEDDTLGTIGRARPTCARVRARPAPTQA
jgi:guanosine-3',5'-bis(diphosphate) 3'-pyrophosphohydrolase